jgi:hypothetical protein
VQRKATQKCARKERSEVAKKKSTKWITRKSAEEGNPDMRKERTK